MDKKATCALVTKLGYGLNAAGCAACVRMIKNSYPEQKDLNTDGILVFSGSELNVPENMLDLMKKNPDMYLILSVNDELRLLPSGPDNLKDYIPVFEEVIKEKTYGSSWELLNAFAQAMDEVNGK